MNNMAKVQQSNYLLLKITVKKANGHLEQKEAVDFPQGSRMDS